MSKKIKKIIQKSIDAKELLLNSDETIQQLQEIVLKISECFKAGKSLYICGNGGSASDAEHIAAELSGRFYLDRPALSCHALSSNNAYITAVANDYGYDEIYARLVGGWMTKGDILLGLSTSGNSKNVINAFTEAKKRNIFTISFLGKSTGQIGDISDISINIQSEVTPRIQESHILIGHIICELVEETVFKDE